MPTAVRLPARVPTGNDMPGMPARFAGIVVTSLRYIASGSSSFSPSLNAVVGPRGHEHVDLRERGVEVALDERAHLLRRAVVGVVVAGRQRVGAEDDAAFDLVAEAGFAGGRHDVLDGAAAGVDAQPKRTESNFARLLDASAGRIR